MLSIRCAPSDAHLPSSRRVALVDLERRADMAVLVFLALTSRLVDAARIIMTKTARGLRSWMTFQPKDASGHSRIDTHLYPPCRFITAAMEFAMMGPAQRDGEFIAWPCGRGHAIGRTANGGDPSGGGRHVYDRVRSGVLFARTMDARCGAKPP
jgi:hypothetical protein